MFVTICENMQMESGWKLMECASEHSIFCVRIELEWKCLNFNNVCVWWIYTSIGVFEMNKLKLNLQMKWKNKINKKKIFFVEMENWHSAVK